MKQRITVLLMLFIVSLYGERLAAQDLNDQRTITGNVLDEDGEGLSGVTVVVKGTNNGVATNDNGDYSIRAYGRDTLIFSFIGMKSIERYIGGESNIDVVLQYDNEQLDDVVVVGYGSQDREDITGAIETIEPDEVRDLPVSNLSEALRGQIPGLSISGGSQRPGDPASLQIRQTFGFSKDGNSNLPLIVIDDMIQVDLETGQPTLETFNRLDPSEIESITVLKDASAAIYGARASQGAVVVKTKRGRIGKPTFNYYSQFAVNDAVSHTKTMSAYEFGVFHNSYLKADNRDNEGANLFSDEELAEMRTLDYDWLDQAWETAFQQRHSLTVSGGSEKATYFAGVTYFDQGANLGDQNFDKYNFRAGMNVGITDDLDISASVSGNSGNVERSFTKATANINDSSYGSKAGGGEQGDYGYLVHMPKYIPITTMVNGEEYYMSPFPRTDRNLQSANSNRTIAGWNYFATLNNGSKQTTEDFAYNVNASVNYRLPFLEGLSVKGTYSRNENTIYTEQVQLPYTLARIKNYNSEGNHLASAAEDDDYKIEENQRNSRVYYNNSRSISTQANLFAIYSNTFGEHDVDAMVSMERSESSFKNNRLGYEGTSSDYLGTSQTAGQLSDNSLAYKGESGTLSYLGRLNYSFRDRYLFQFLFRSDASTKFAPENYWGFFPSLQVGWIVSKEDWFEERFSGIDFFKLRYSVGKTGKDNIKPWQWVQYYDIYVDKGFQFGGNGGQLGGALSPKLNPNRNVHWDQTIKHNFGIDMNFLQNRLQIGTDFYYDKTTDLLVNTASTAGVPISVGGGFAEQNFGAVNAWGSEFTVNWRDQIKDDFSYSVGVNFGFSDNEVQKFPEQAIQHPSYNVTAEGNSLYFPAWGFKTWDGTSTGDGILRTDADVQNYWNYLSERAAAAGTEPSYLGINSIDGIQKGMLAYTDQGGAFNAENGTQAGPDGRIDNNLDYVELDDNNRSYGFTTNLRFDFKGFYLRTQLATSWGSYTEIDRVKQGTSSSHNFWAHESYWTDMYDEDFNTDGAYPNLAFYDASSLGANSDFWQVDSFRATVRNLSIGYELPKNFLSKINVQRASLGLTGNNLWDLYNPYPDHYRNMYDNSYVAYPTLRTWSFNVNLSF